MRPGQTELRRSARRAALRFESEAAERERRLFLTAKFDRTWSTLTRLRAKVGAARFRDLLVDLPDALDELCSPDLGAIAEFHGAPLGAGSAGEAIALAGGGRAWFGLASDPFRGNGPALRAFFKAIDEGHFDATPFDRQVDVFAGRNVTALVVELPSSTLAAPTIGVWSEVSLYGHAPQRRVARAAWPLIKHVLVRDEHARAHLDEDPPSSDPATVRAAAIANVATVTRLAGTTADPAAYARRVASIVLPDILPYRPASVASFGFAGINGRALGDAALDVVFTLLANRPLAGTVPADPAANARPFPYLAAPSTLAGDAKPLRAPLR